MAKKKVAIKKIELVKLTEEERVLIAENIDSPFMKLLLNKILPSRVTNVALTCISAAQDDNDLWYYKGMVYEAKWLPKFLQDQIENVDDADYENVDDEEGEIDAKDDNPN
jgi:hypothetical protein